jgi:nucleoside-diphosphate-sugar epimerase
MSKIIVTGASGFIGRALVLKLNSHGWDVIPVTSSDGDIADRTTLEKFLSQDIAHVFHLAGKTFVPDSWANPHVFYQTNVLGTVSALEFCRVNCIPLTYVSAYVYGHPNTLPICEDSAVKPNNPYAMSKWLAEQTCEFYSNAYCLPVTTIRPFNAYGIGQAENFLIASLISQALDGGESIVVNDLTPKRDYVYLEDLLTALMATLKTENRYRVFNIGSGKSLSVKNVIDVIQNVVGIQKNIVCDKVVRRNELMDVVADISMARKELGWHPEYSFQTGIEHLINSVMRNK